ncbi:TetR family transcriptional regulator [Streptomyces bingchenggensis BCW-1]|uniref:TetR family transcriptional regulator n=1 Tax=Streptomyces bingchenggensis (strain BCW-1) TaxID=749414 RepID=D7C9S1_STRBB|nr:TetR family transcriptional regulator [Streptomyces bingchenggensis BCW-1]
MGHTASVTGDRESRPRRRGEELEGALLDAAWDELVEHGWNDFSMPRVARRAGAGKASLYARWRTKAALIAATSFRQSQLPPGPLDLSGSLAENLRSALDGTCAFLRGPYGSAARALASESPTLDLSQRPADTPIQVAVEIIEHARARGELGPSPIPPRVLNVGFALVIQSFLVDGALPGPEELDEIVACVWLPALRAAAPTD